MPTKEEIERGAEAIRAYLRDGRTEGHCAPTPEHLAELVLTAAERADHVTLRTPNRYVELGVGFDDNGVPGEGEI